jgi:hypothetical protein
VNGEEECIIKVDVTIEDSKASSGGILWKKYLIYISHPLRSISLVRGVSISINLNPKSEPPNPNASPPSKKYAIPISTGFKINAKSAKVTKEPPPEACVKAQWLIMQAK